MSKKIIKKISLILLIALSISFLGISRVNANNANADHSLGNSANAIKNGYDKICSYHGEKNDSANKYDWSVYIFYKGNGLIGDWWVLAETTDKSRPGYSVYAVYNNINKALKNCGWMNGNTHASSTAIHDLDAFSGCPKYAYVHKSFNNSNSVCFDSGGYCQSDKYKCGNDYKKSPKIKLAEDNTKNYRENASTKFDVSDYKGEANCKGILGGSKSDLIKWIQKLFNIIKILAPLLVLGLTIFEFAKAIVSQDQDALKKAGNLFVKRLIIMVVLFFLPTIINLLLDLIDNTNGTCNIK